MTAKDVAWNIGLLGMIFVNGIIVGNRLAARQSHQYDAQQPIIMRVGEELQFRAYINGCEVTYGPLDTPRNGYQAYGLICPTGVKGLSTGGRER